MAKNRRSSGGNQPNHKPKGRASRHDKRDRLTRANPRRRKTTEARFPLVFNLHVMVTQLSKMLDGRIGFRLLIICAGMMLSDDRRVAAAWFSVTGVQDDWDRFYDCLIAVGNNSGKLSLALAKLVLTKFDPGPDGRICLAVDDTPTKRFGKFVEGAGIHHNPTPGPADGNWLWGHNWVSLCLLSRHKLWGTIAFPLRSLLYIRKVDIAKVSAKYRWEFRTKHQLGVELVLWVWGIMQSLKMECQLWLVADGAYAARKFIKPLRAVGIVVFSRLRSDAELFGLPVHIPGQVGRNRIYGKDKISLKKRAAARGGWQSITYSCRGVMVTRQYKTFLAASKFAGGQIRVVIVRYSPTNWAAYFCTSTAIDAKDIVEVVADRWAIEEHFRDVKEVWGAGQQQVRNLWSNIGCWHLNQWMYTMVELAAWDSPLLDMSDRKQRPWDNQLRRPSHADKRHVFAKEMLEKQFLETLPSEARTPKLRKLIADFIWLAA